MPQGDVTNPNLPACSSRICRQAQGVPQGGCASRLHQKKTTTDRRRRLRGAQSGVRPNSTCAMISGICVPSFAVLHPPSGWMQHRMGPPVWCFLSYSAVCVCRCAGNNRYGFAPILPQDGQNGSSLAAGFILYFCISCHETEFQLQSGKMPVAVSVAETRLAQRAETGRTRRTGRLAFVRNGAGANEDIAALAAAPVASIKKARLRPHPLPIVPTGELLASALLRLLGRQNYPSMAGRTQRISGSPCPSRNRGKPAGAQS